MEIQRASKAKCHFTAPRFCGSRKFVVYIANNSLGWVKVDYVYKNLRL